MTRGMRLLSMLFGVALTASLLIGGCTPISSDGHLAAGRSNRFTQPHVLRYTTDEDIVGLNPWFNQQLTLAYMAEMTMAWLFRYDHENRPIPELATVYPTQQNGGIGADGRTITFHLRRGVVWSDGVPFSADDVVFSIHQVLNPANNVVSRDGWDLIDRIEEPDRYTVRLHLRHPYAEFEPLFFSTGGANPCILPKHLLAGLPSLNNAPYNALPVGIGPFRYERWDRADRVVLVPNPRYFRGLPRLHKVIFQIIPDRNTVLAQIESGALDLWIPASSYFYDRLKALPGYRVVRQPSYRFSHIDFNLSNPILADLRVREALRYGIDRPTLRAKVGHGFGILQESYLSPVYPNVPPPIPPLPYSPAKANALLDAAGWRRGPDGIRVKQGRQLRFVFAVGTAAPDVDASIELLRSWWGALGVALDVRHYPSPVLFASYQEGGIISAGKYDIVAFSWQVDALDNMFDILGCGAIPPSGQNNTHYCNPAADRLITAFNQTYDPVEQRRLKAELMRIFVHDVPMIVTGVSENLYVANRDLRDFRPNQVSGFDDMMRVDIY